MGGAGGEGAMGPIVWWRIELLNFKLILMYNINSCFYENSSYFLSFGRSHVAERSL